MKNYKLLLIILLGSIFMCTKCAKNTTDNGFSFDKSQFKKKFFVSDVAKLSLLNAEKKSVDSIVFYVNDMKIGSQKGSDVYKFPLTNQKLGYQNLRADVFYDGEIVPQNVVSKIEIVSNVTPKLLKYEIVNTYPHDIEAYTQGLEFYRDTLIEGTGNGTGDSGRKGISSLRKVDYRTGKVYKIVEYPENVFGEGITILNNKIYQLTWKNNEVYVYDADNLTKDKTMPYPKKMEGWGLTNDGKNLYLTDSSEIMQIVSPTNFQIIGSLTIYSGETQVPSVNELEWVDGKIFGNVYLKDAIAVINAKSGAVEAVVDLKNLLKKITKLTDTDVLNGIAYNPKSKTFFVTGKNWDKMFEIRILDPK